jgi:hypothetical protein
MAFVEVGDDHFRQRTRVFSFVDKLRVDRLLADQNGDAGTLGLIILSGDVQNIGTDDRAGF